MAITLTVTRDKGVHSVGNIRNHNVDIDRPKEQGGTDFGPKGGELFLMGLGGCFMTNLAVAMEARGIDIPGIKVDINAELAEKPQRFSDIEMVVYGEYTDRKEFEKLVTIAERACLVANTVKQAVNLKVTVV